ncbi:hypothetical protein [Mycolicibacter hiberniae]|uniref:Uncharacterized protein n=1 Tax=Mycolicibacter hiberniae TaxID=29314 RepID=A0A7I7X2C9_9MYCO|nr:hypothetical protein [Mycolicibacter hiberniae]MCV7088093.1 hypothetical protein [Mycolicibacter hiberniae]ORV66128.1 hypothetical protein AWC09_01115 [Mycolicibacter hiberniae]BBZ23836.1 hypothetical protein MHIB_22540 [Mycolicibacter hiberniae]
MLGPVGAGVDQLRALRRRITTPGAPPILGQRAPGPKSGGAPTLCSGRGGAPAPGEFPSPFDAYQDPGGQTSLWPIGIGTAIGTAAFGTTSNYLDREAATRWGGVVSDFAKADFILAAAATDAAFPVSGDGSRRRYLPKLISKFCFPATGS